MIEVIKHVLGLCGEGHVNIFMVLGVLLTSIAMGWNFIMSKLKSLYKSVNFMK